jgi:uncharacterized membrane protein
MKFRLGFWKSAVLLFLMLSISENTHAYLGPGAGLGMIGGLIAVIIAIVFIVFGLIFYPIRRYLKHRSTSKQS